MSSALDFLANKNKWTIISDLLGSMNDVLDKREGSVIYDAVSAVGAVMGDLFNIEVPSVYGAINAMLATGSDLDAWANSYGLERLQSTYTYYNVLIQGSSNDADLEIGERLRSHNTNEVWIYEGNHVVVSEDAGDYVETVGSVLEPDSQYDDISSITILSLKNGGRNEETDDELRARLIRQLSVKVGGSVFQYVDLVLNEYNDGNGFYACLVYPCGRRCGYVDILPVNEDFDADNERWASQEECSALKEWLDPETDEGWGYGKCPIGHRARIKRGEYYDLKFKIWVVFDENETTEQVPDEVQEAVKRATIAYLNKVIDQGLFTSTNTPERHGDRYHMVYISSEHVAALESVKEEYNKENTPKIITFQLSYQLPGSEEWLDQSDDLVNLKMRRKNVKMFRVASENGFTFIRKPRTEDKGVLDW